MSHLANKLKKAFKDKDYRHGYVDEFLNATIATQIKVLREQRAWTQLELAQCAQMKQPRISVMENVNYSSWSIKVLRELAEAFDLTLCVSFESFGKRLADIERFSREALERFSFKDDPVFAEREERGIAAATKAFPEAQEDLAGGRPMLRVVQRASAEAAQSKIKPQVEDAWLRKMGDSGIERELSGVA